MDSGGLVRRCLLLVISLCVCVVSGNPPYTSVIYCSTGSSEEFGPVDEGYEGDVEMVPGIAAESGVKLVPNGYDKHLEYLELIFNLGDASITIRTKKPLDADTLTDSDGSLFYSIMCDGEIKYNNTRRLNVTDINDNSPIFEEKHYSNNVSESESVGFEVVRVTATDADSTAANNAITYSLEPASEDFEVTSAGAVCLKRRLNYNLVQQYNFTVTASDPEGLNDTATVVINVEDYDNLNPYFSHNLYQASIPENQDGPFKTIEPEAIKAQDGDTGINMTLTYNISEVSPAEYQSNFHIESSSGVLSLHTPIDREEMSSDVISVNIKAAQTDDSSKTANAVVSVTIEDVNDNAPEFDRSNYSVSLLENSPVDAVVFRATVTDLDQGGFVGKLRILPESVPFSIDSDGTVRVKDSTALDRETTNSFTFQIEAVDPPNNITTAEVSVTLLDENDNSPVFTSNTYEGKVFANQTAGMLLVQVEAEDVDDGANAQITYSIDFGNTDGYFSIEEKTGKITLAKVIPLVTKRTLEFPLYVTARDGGTISRSTTAQVIIRAQLVNEPPQFSKLLYEASVVSIAVYKTPIVTVEASDPDVGDQGRLVYSVEDATYFDVDPSTGLVFVVSAVELAGQKVELKVHVDDPQGLRATTTVEVTVGGSVSSSDVVVISLNQPANTVENKILDMENSLTKVLGWTVNVIEVSNINGRASESRMQRMAVWTRVSLICLDGGTVVSGEEVTMKLQSQSEDVRAELVKVFGDNLQFEIESEPQGPASNQAVVITLSVLSALSMVGLIVCLSRRGSIRRFIGF